MKLSQLILLTILFLSTESMSQLAIDSVLLSFRAELEKKNDSKNIFKNYVLKFPQLTNSCENKIRLYKAYSNFQYNQYKDGAVLVLERDSILPLQKLCLEESDDRITTTLLNIARSYQFLTQYHGLDFLAEAEEYFLIVGMKQNQAPITTKLFSKRYEEIAEYYNYIKDYKKAALYFERALNIFQGNKETEEFMRILMGKAKCLIRSENYNEAIKLLIQTKKIGESNRQVLKVELSRVYDRLAESYKSIEQYDIAETYIIQAREIAKTPDGGGLSNAIIYASQHGHILTLWGRFNKAHKIFLEARELIQKLGKKVTIKQVSANNEDIADVFYGKGDFVRSVELYHKGISSLVSIPPGNILANPRIQGNEIFDNQYLHRQLGLKALALYKYGMHSNKTEALLGSLDAIIKYDTLSQEILKSTWEEDSHQLRIKGQNSFYETGIKAAIELFNITGDADYLDDAHQVSSRYKSQLLQRGISIKDKKQATLPDSLLQIEKDFKERISQYESGYLMDLAGEKETAQSLKKYLDEKTKLDKFYFDNKVSDLVDKTIDATSVSLQDLQAELDEQTAIMEYFVAEEKIYIFLITQNEIDYNILNVSDLNFDQYFKYLVTDSGRDTNLDPTPLVSLLADEKLKHISKLIIIPDQQLLQLPFEALKLNDKYLVEQYDISYQYSTSFFIQDKKRNSGKPFLGFASDFTLEDKEGSSSLASLPYAVEEIETAQDLLNGHTYINDQATKQSFVSQAEQSRIIHLALHSQLNSTYPDQSSLVFQSDSTYEHLTASEIYNLDLHSDLTVLSACNTAVGEINPGDGVRSITRSFIHAGSNSVLTTLWEAPDVSTSQIIQGFYEELKKGAEKDVALRTAKLNYLENIQPSFRHPKYWAHLVLVGDRQAMELESGFPWVYLVVVLGLVVLVYFIYCNLRQ